jgi:beta-glucosidase
MHAEVVLPHMCSTVTTDTGFWRRYPHWSNGPSEGEGGCFTEWEFGKGLSFTTFEYSNLALTKTLLQLQDTTTATVVVTNTGAMTAKHTVMLFISDEYRIITPEVKMLKHFQKITLDAGASQVGDRNSEIET